MTKDYYLYYVKSACKSIKFTKTPADKWAEGRKRQFSKEEIQLVNKHKKNMFILSINQRCAY